MLYRLLYVCLLAFCFTVAPCPAEAAGITNYDKLITADYWTAQSKDGDKLILDEKGVKNFNKQVNAASRTVPDLLAYPASISGDSLRTRIMDYAVLEDDLYLNGNKVSENYKSILRKQTNTARLAAETKVRYAVTVRRSSMRILPTGEGLYYYAGDRDFDALQQTELDPGEPVIVLHESSNKFFYYVQAVNYCGWISKFDIAFTDKGTWKDFADPESFLIVTDASIKLKVGAEQVLYQQGAKLPIVSEKGSVYTVVAPVRKKDGTLGKEELWLRKDRKDIHEGYLPYTANNIIRSAFKFHGMPYGWGGLKNSVDCSSLIFNAYRSVGIILPRDADQQEYSAGKHISLEGLDSRQRMEKINTLAPGAGLYMDGHALLYIGKINAIPYAIHSLGSYYDKGQRYVVMEVVVSDLSLQRSNGNAFVDELTTLAQFR